MAKTFERGAHIPHYKETTEREAIQDLPLPKELIIPLKQHLGAPNQPLVAAGEKVTAGQKIGDSEAFVSAPVHTGLSGVVRVIEKRATLTGEMVDCVIIDVDSNQPEQSYKEVNISSLKEAEILQHIREAGIVGMGGAAFPAHIKLNPPKGVDYLILNGCECEPFLTCDHRLMLEYADEIIAGARLVAKVLGGVKVFIGIETNKEDAIKVLEQKVKNESDIEVVPVAVKYPQGSEKQLIYAVSQRAVPPGKLPFEVAVVVQNVASAKAVYEAVSLRKPLTERIVTLTGPGAIGPGNYRITLGTSIAHIIESTGGLRDNVIKVVMGGPMTGFAQTGLEAPIVKGCGGILALTEDITTVPVEHMPCVRCGKCVDNCPMFLYPNYIGIYGELGKYNLAKQWGASDCFECGICSYVCPSNRPIIEFVRRAKKS